MPASKISQAPNFTYTDTSQIIDGPVIRSRAKKLQQEIHMLLCEIHFNINENYILPKCSTLIVLRYIEEENDESDPKEQTSTSPRRRYKTDRRVKNGPVEVKNGPVQRNLHNFLLTKSMKAHENLLESLSSLLSNESSGDQFRYSILPADQNYYRLLRRSTVCRDRMLIQLAK